MQRKPYMFPLLALLIGAMAITVLVNRKKQTQQSPAAESSVSEEQSTEPYQYLLRTEAQTLELFLLRQGQWSKIADYPVMLADLPETDQALLANGIALRNTEELQRTLEDYLPFQ